MDLFGDWLATKHGMLDTLLAMIESGEIADAQTRTELLEAITTILDAGSAARDLRADVTAASLIGIFTVVGKPGQHAQASRLLNLLMDGPEAPGHLALSIRSNPRPRTRARKIGRRTRSGRRGARCLTALGAAYCFHANWGGIGCPAWPVVRSAAGGGAGGLPAGVPEPVDTGRGRA
jgi:hypothetical protein